MARAAGARLDPGRSRRRHAAYNTVRTTCRPPPRPASRTGTATTAGRVLRQGRDQGRVPAHRGLRFGARARVRRRTSCSAWSSRIASTPVRRCDRAALRGGDHAQAVREDWSVGSSRRCSATSRPGSPSPNCRVTAARSRASRPTTPAIASDTARSRPESEQGYVKDELRGDGTSGLYRLSAPAADREQRQAPARGARSLPQRSDRRVAAADALHRLQHRLSERHAVLQAAGAEPRRVVQPRLHDRRVRSAERGEQSTTAGGRATAQLAGDARGRRDATSRKARRPATRGSPARTCAWQIGRH